MHILMTLGELESRAAGVNLSLRDLCRLAGINQSNVTRWKKDHGSPLVRTLQLLSDRLIESELALLKYLHDLHPDIGAATPSPAAHAGRAGTQDPDPGGRLARTALREDMETGNSDKPAPFQEGAL